LPEFPIDNIGIAPVVKIPEGKNWVEFSMEFLNSQKKISGFGFLRFRVSQKSEIYFLCFSEIFESTFLRTYPIDLNIEIIVNQLALNSEPDILSLCLSSTNLQSLRRIFDFTTINLNGIFLNW